MSRLALALAGLFLCVRAHCAVGIYEWKAEVNPDHCSATIQYRLNCPATVAIDIIDDSEQTVCSLGPYDEPAGLRSHQWDGSGSSAGREYRARITAVNPGSPPEDEGKLVPLFTHHSASPRIYGIAIDRCASSPAYGTIYASEVVADAVNITSGMIRAYHPDGSPKYGFGGNPEDNVLSLGFPGTSLDAPWGIGVDSQGNIYAARKAAVGLNPGVKVFSSSGVLLHEVSVSETTGNFWAEGLAASGGLEVYETVGILVRCASISDGVWRTVMGPGLSNRYTKQICFEPGGAAAYVATVSSGMGPTNPGIRRYTRAPGQDWVQDTSFSCGLSAASSGPANFVYGVSCDAIDPDGAGPYTASCLWIGLDVANPPLGPGNIVRKQLPDGTPQHFAGPGGKARTLAGDAVGNVAIEFGSPAATSPWSDWGLYAIGARSSTDVRVTDWIAMEGAAGPDLVSRITEIRAMPDGGFVELTEARQVSAAYDDGFYLQEPDRSGGIRVVGASAPALGALIKVRGVLARVNGERVLTEAQIVP